MKKIKFFIWIILCLILIGLLCKSVSYYHLWRSYLINKDFYGFKNFSDYLKSYRLTKEIIMAATLRQKGGLIVEDNYNRRYYIPNIKIGNFISTNSFGMKDKQITLKKPMGVYRILVLSDSRAISGSNPNSTFPAILERQLNAIFPERKFEVINGGISGATTLNLFMNFSLSWRKLEPDLIILDVGLSDATINVRPFYLKHYLINRLFGRISNKPFKEGLEAFETELETLVYLGKSMGCKVVLLTIQTALEGDFSPQKTKRMTQMFQSHIGFELKRALSIIEEHNRIIEKIANNNGAIFIDMSNAVPEEERYFLDATHRSDAGNEVYIEVLLKKLLELGMFI